MGPMCEQLVGRGGSRILGAEVTRSGGWLPSKALVSFSVPKARKYQSWQMLLRKKRLFVGENHRSKAYGCFLHTVVFGFSHICYRLGGGVRSMHGRSRTTVGPCILTLPGRSTSNFHQPVRFGYGGGVIISCMTVVPETIDARLPTMPGKSTSSFHRPDRRCMHQARIAARFSASRMKGELHPAKVRL